VTERLDELERRLAEAERHAAAAQRQVRGLYGLLIAVVAVGAFVLPLAGVVAQGKGTKVSQLAAPFQVVDGQGRLLMMVDTARPGTRLQLFGSSGRPIAELGTNPKLGGRLVLFDRTGKTIFAKP
jgi:hypothetical protein